MKIFAPREKEWQHYAWLAATVVVVVLLASHPELRVLIPVIDVMGLDVLVLLVGSQLWEYARPYSILVRAKVVRPIAIKAYVMVLFVFGYMSVYVDASVRSYYAGIRFA